MGRLFWKFFFFLFLAQLTAVVGVGLSIWAHSRKPEIRITGIALRPPARSLVEAAASTLEFGGVNGLKGLLQHWTERKVPQVYAVNEQGKELIGRKLDAKVLLEAQQMVEDAVGEKYVKSMDGNDGHHYLIFVPGDHDAGTGYTSRNSGTPPSRLDDSYEMGNQVGPRFDRPPPRNEPMPAKIFPAKPFMAGVIVSLLFAAILAWYFSKPIKNLRMAFEEAADGHLDVRVGNAMGGRSDELSDLGRDFDSMADRLSNLIKGQTRLLHQVSHELRSPLARMQMALGLARQNVDKIPSSLERIEREANRMDKLVGELLELSRLESGVINIRKDMVDVSELLASVVEDAQYEADQKHVKIQFNLKYQFAILGEHELLHRAIENIVRNAIKYSPEGGLVSINVDRVSNNRLMSIMISDQGPGVADDELLSIFEPFVRGVKTSNSEGHGIGLAIAKQIIESHEGTIAALNRPEGGLSLEVRLNSVMVSS